jgi:transposase
MSQNVVYVGIDVDDVRYYGAALDKRTGETLDFQCRPTLKGLVQQLNKVQENFGGLAFKLCYEASYVGFSLQADLKAQGFDCEVVPPSSIPRRAGKAVKTDRIDATEMAELYANGLLTIVAASDAQTEQDCDLLRSRQQLIQQQGKDTQTHPLIATAQWLSLQALGSAQDPLANPSLRLARQNDCRMCGQPEGQSVTTAARAQNQ